MNARELKRLGRLISDPPAGSKIAAAKEFGIDLTLVVRKLELTPTERLRELAAAQRAVAELRRAKRDGR